MLAMSNRLDEGLDVHTKYALQTQRTELELKSLNGKFSEQVSLFRKHVEEDRIQNDKHLEILSRISNQVNSTQLCLDKLNSKVDLSTQKLQSEIEKINKLDEQQNRMLDEHIAGVNTLKKIHELQKEEVGKRLKELEKPREWLKTTRKGVLWLGGIAASVYSILKLFEVI
jgi:hypothetical protein